MIEENLSTDDHGRRTPTPGPEVRSHSLFGKYSSGEASDHCYSRHGNENGGVFVLERSDEEITQTACESVKMYSYEVSLKRNRPVFCF